jgi:hypothetical protein
VRNGCGQGTAGSCATAQEGEGERRDVEVKGPIAQGIKWRLFFFLAGWLVPGFGLNRLIPKA